MPASALDARVALALVFAATLGLVTIPLSEPATLALFALATALTVAALRPKASAIVRPLRHAAPLLVLLLVTVPLSVPGERWFALFGGLAVSREGSVLAAMLAVKATLALVLFAAVSARLGPSRMLGALRGLGVPEAPVTILALAQRFAGVIAREWRRLRRAALSRSPRTGTHQRAPLLARLAALLLVRSLDRSERVHRAMIARGFGGAAAAGTARLAAHDAVALALGLTAVVALRVAGMLLA